MSLPQPCCCLATQSCLTLCNSMDYSLPGSSVRGISQGVAISYSRRSSRLMGGIRVCCVAGGFFTTESPGKPSPCPRQPLIHCQICLFLTFHTNGIIQYVVFYSRLPSFSIRFLRIIHVVACISTSFLFIAKL